jgi:hypothetical protein
MSHICGPCRSGNHDSHRPALAGICVGCACAWTPTVVSVHRTLMRKEDVVRIAEGLALDELQKRVRLFPKLVAALEGLLREEWMTYEGNLEATGHASVDDLEAARAALAEARHD